MMYTVSVPSGLWWPVLR